MLVWFSNLISHHHLFTLIVITILAGLLGGTTNHLMALDADIKPAPDANAKPAPDVEKIPSRLGRCIFIGLTAAFLVPLFLGTLSSSLINYTDKDFINLNYLKFAGFCLLAAISSRAFIETLSQKVLRQTEQAVKTAKEAKKDATEAKNEASDAKQQAETVADTLSEPGSDETPPGKGMAPLKATQKIEISDPEKKVLQAIVNNRKYVYRTLSGIAKEIECNQAETKDTLDKLIEQRLVGTRERIGSVKFYATEAGRRLVA